MGYTINGWHLDDPRGTGSLAATRDAGPPGYPAAQLTLVCANAAAVWTADPRSLRETALAVRSGELYCVHAQMRLSSGREARLIARFFGISLHTLPDFVLADAGSIDSSWKHIETPFSVPGGAAYMALGIQLHSGVVCWTDFSLRSCA
jgi:hypothetical protein